MKYHTQRFHGGLRSIIENSKIVVQEDAYDTPGMQKLIGDHWTTQRDRLTRNQRWRPNERDHYVLAQLRKVVDHAFLNIPFYRKLYTSAGYSLGDIRSISDFKSLPTLDKQSLRNAASYEFLHLGAKNHETFRSSTSGSSGSALTIHSDQHDIINNVSAYYRLFHRVGGANFTPESWIYNVHHIRGWPSSLHGKYRTFTLNDIVEKEEFIQHLEYLRPRILNLLPSYLPFLSDYAERIAALQISAIITNSESSTAQERSHYSRLYNTIILDEYSSEEVGIIAVECPHRRYHIDEDFIYAEFDKGTYPLDESLHTLYCTDFMSREMPLIRYDHGDCITVNPGIDRACPCGHAGISFSTVEGRRDDLVVAHDHTLVPSATITNMLDSIFNSHPCVKAFRLTQHIDRNHFILEYEGSTLCQTTADDLKKKLAAFTGRQIFLVIKQFEVLPALKSYKRRKVIVEH